MTSAHFDETYKILLASPEVFPFAKTGGLADVAGSLPKALSILGNDVRVVLPRYRGINPIRTIGDFPVQVGSRKATAIVREGEIKANWDGIDRSVPVYFIDNYHYFDRDRMYAFFDEAERYAFFCRAVLEMLKLIDFRPDIIHCNDWQTGPIPLLLKDQYRHDPFYSRISTVYTIHNLQYQGNYPKECLSLLSLGDEYFHPDRLEFYGNMSFMKAGILYADVVSTVSRTYAREIQTKELGHGMDGVLRTRSTDLYGIVNGINYHEYNPATDPRIHENYSEHNPENKVANKHALQREMGLPMSDSPLIGLVSRLVDHKGLDIISDALDEMMQMDLQFMLLGSGDKYYEDMFREAARKYPDKIAAEIGFNAGLAQRIYAGSDMFLMPSKFEPCGLGQLISLRYGTIPVVRATGGLADTITDYDPATPGAGNGFTFAEYSGQALLSALKRAAAVYRRRDEWNALVLTALKQDFSWNRSAAEYMGLYKAAVNKQVVPLTA